MGFGKKKNRLARIAVKALAVTVLLAGIGGGGYLAYQKKTGELKAAYEAQLEAMTLEAYALKRLAWMPTADLPAGTLLSEENVEQVEIKSSIENYMYLDSFEEGMMLKVDVLKDMPLMTAMVTKEFIGADLREAELNMLLLPTNLKSGKQLDVRICLPDGEDFIVLSKKQVRNLKSDQNTVWLWLDEKELLTLDSAIVDAYLHPGTKLYTVNYIEPTIQKAAIPTYPVNEAVRQVMLMDPNILEEAKAGLADDQRVALETRLKSMTEESLQQMEAGVTQEETVREQAVTQNQLQLDQQAIESQDVQAVQEMQQAQQAPVADAGAVVDDVSGDSVIIESKEVETDATFY